MLNRRQFIVGGLSVGLVGAAVTAGDAGLVEPYHPVVKRVEVPLARLPRDFDGVTIAQLSDFHYDEHSTEILGGAVRRINDLKPDIVVLTGDFVSMPLVGSKKKAALDAVPCAQILSELRAPLGVFAVLGNHDHGTDAGFVARALDSRGIAVLRNFNLSVERNGAKLWIAGVDDVLYPAADLPKALRGIPAEGSCILLVHEPDYADVSSQYPVDLQLSGHSHGGQVRLPLVGAPYLPRMARKYPWGLRKVGSMPLYTNCGIGTLLMPIRLDCPPEITLLRLQSRTAAAEKYRFPTVDSRNEDR